MIRKLLGLLFVLFGVLQIAFGTWAFLDPIGAGHANDGDPFTTVSTSGSLTLILVGACFGAMGVFAMAHKLDFDWGVQKARQMRRVIGVILLVVGAYYGTLGVAVLVDSWQYFLSFDRNHEGLQLAASILLMLLIGGSALIFGFRLLKRCESQK